MYKKTMFSFLGILALVGLFAGGNINTASAQTATTTCNNVSWSATLYGTVTPNGSPTEAWFEWGPTASIQYQTPHQIYSTTSSHSQVISNLAENSTYYYRLMAKNDYGTASGATKTFQTGTCNQPVNNPPSVTLTADNTNISYNSSTTLRWSSTNATSCSSSGGTNGWSTSNRSTSGSFNTGALTNNTTYSINCTNNSGQTADDSVKVNVGGQVQTCQEPSATNYGGALPCYFPTQTCQEPTATNYGGALPCIYPQICQDPSALNYRGAAPCRFQNNNQQPTVNLTADDRSIDYNDSTVIRWTSTNADSCSSSGGTNGWSTSNRSTSGSFNTGSLTSDRTYNITCRNNYGSADDSVTINVDDNNDNNNNDEGPDVTTRNATNVTTYSATLNGEVDGNGLSTRAWFEYGRNTSLGSETSESSYGSGSTNYNRSISGLNPNTTYYFRAVAENSEDTAYGNILSFTTPGDYNNPQPVNNQPTVVIYADSTNIAYNASTTIRWGTVNATSCFASGGSIGWAGEKSIGPGSFYTGSLTGTRTYTITCSNNVGSATDSVTVGVRGQTVTTVNSRPAPTSLVLITSSVDRNQPIVPTLDNTRPHPGDEINYTVTYQNIGTAAITNLTLRIDLPYEVDYMFSNPSNPVRSGNTLIFSLGTLRANGEGTVTVRVRVRENIPAGTSLNFPALLSYVDPSGFPQTVNANVTAQVWNDQSEVTIPLGANVFGAGFLPTNIFGWLLLLILILLLIALAKYLLGQPFRQRTTTIVQ